MAATLMVACGLVASACVSQDEPGLAVSELEASLVFGVAPEEDDAPTPAEAAIDSVPQARRPTLSIPTDDDLPEFSPPPPPPPALCPTSTEIAVEFEALANVPPGVRPAEGVYRWMINAGVFSPVETDDPEDDYRVEPVGSELRAIRNVQDIPRDQWSPNPVNESLDRQVFTYEEVRPLRLRRAELDRPEEERFLVTTYQIDTDAVTASTSATGAVIQTPRGGDPERGVAVIAVEVVDGNNEPVSSIRSFRPSNGILVLPLATSSAEQYTSAAVDPTSGRSVQHSAVVGVRERIDACGKLMEGWRVDATQSITESANPDDVTRINYHIMNAPQHGGIMIWERFTDQLSAFVAEYTLGQFEPDPLPADGLPR